MSSISLEALISWAKNQKASDLHLEPGISPVIRIRGTVTHSSLEPISPSDLSNLARQLLNEDDWSDFLEKKSFDLSKTISGVRCRINVLKTSRGVGMSIRLLSSFKASIDKLNLHPVLKEILNYEHGLVLISGPTGCGKSTTLAALIEEINNNLARHIITIESPIEYYFKSQKSLIRQREVGRDTPSFKQALIDALREDPDVIMMGEMRDPETMKLTLNAAETGHLVFATVHSSNVAEAVQRVVSAFPAEIQESIRSQLAESLLAVVSQNLRYRADLQIRVPECEILFANTPSKIAVREGKYFKFRDILQTGASENMWSFSRYANWIQSKNDWYIASDKEVYEDEIVLESAHIPPSIPVQRRNDSSTYKSERNFQPTTRAMKNNEVRPSVSDDVLVIHDEDDLDNIVRNLK